MSTYHIPVLRNEVISGLQVREGKKYIDATIGGGGHAWEIVKRGGILLGLDTDKEAVGEAQEELRRNAADSGLHENWIVRQGNFRDIAEIAKQEGFDRVEGILFDLGVSSHQLDQEGRGFSYRFEHAPLDLRMNQNAGDTVADIVNTASEEELYEIFAKFGEEERSGAIAHALLSARSVKQIETVGDLVGVVRSIVPDDKERYGVLSRIFQALRIVVNDEMNALKSGLTGAEELLVSGGRLAVISFHSLEDRTVKQFMKGTGWKLLVKKPVVAGHTEEMENRRSRSAKLRIAVKL